LMETNCLLLLPVSFSDVIGMQMIADLSVL